MYKILLLALITYTPWLSNNFIFLEKPQKIYVNNTFNLNKEDIRYIRYFFLKESLIDFKLLPNNTSRKNVNNFFLILKNQKNKRWTKAYLLLLSIVPEIFIEDEIGC